MRSLAVFETYQRRFDFTDSTLALANNGGQGRSGTADANLFLGVWKPYFFFAGKYFFSTEATTT